MSTKIPRIVGIDAKSKPNRAAMTGGCKHLLKTLDIVASTFSRSSWEEKEFNDSAFDMEEPESLDPRRAEASVVAASSSASDFGVKGCSS
mmetsp:Transcript_21650/g.44516  ORF Transcript_21650/g.44516 Transcript_21650/m.44516 type:complete len:90 (-) Transcript_21650:915-1184(-)